MVDAGWYPDPQSSDNVRWWDGQRWTDHVSPRAEAASASLFADPTSPEEPVPPQYSSPTQDTVSFDAPTYAAPTSATTAYDAVDFAPVAAQADPSFVPPLSSYAAAPGATTTKRSSGALAALVVGAVFLVVAGIGIGFAVTRSATTRADPAVTPSAPAPSRTPENPGPSQAPSKTPSPAPSSTATGLGAELEALKPTEDDLPEGTAMELIEGGDQVTGERTLDGWCSMSYASEKNRVERRQWDLVQGTQSTGLSIEVVAYRTPEDAAAALAEFTRFTKACTGVTLNIDGASLTQTVTSSRALAPADGVTGEQAVARWLVPQAGAAARTLHSVATVQRSEQILSIVWVNQATAFTPDDLAAINAFVAQQTRALTSTVHG
jgi:hypothetical protein